MASIYDLLRALGHKGGPAAGKPYMEPGKPTHQYMNLSENQAMAPHTLAATLASHGPKGENALKQKLNAAQQQRLAIREQELAAGGYDPHTAVYGAHANKEALAYLQGGTGLGRSLGLAQGPPEAAQGYGPARDAGPLDFGSLLAQTGRRDRRARRRGYSVS